MEDSEVYSIKKINKTFVISLLLTLHIIPREFIFEDTIFDHNPFLQ